MGEAGKTAIDLRHGKFGIGGHPDPVGRPGITFGDRVHDPADIRRNVAQLAGQGLDGGRAVVAQQGELPGGLGLAAGLVAPRCGTLDDPAVAAEFILQLFPLGGPPDEAVDERPDHPVGHQDDHRQGKPQRHQAALPR